MIAQKQANKKSLINKKKDIVTNKTNVIKRRYGVFFCMANKLNKINNLVILS